MYGDKCGELINSYGDKCGELINSYGDKGHINKLRW